MSEQQALSRPPVMVMEMDEITKAEYFKGREATGKAKPILVRPNFYCTGDGKGNVTISLTVHGKFFRGPMGDYKFGNMNFYNLREVKVQYTAIWDYSAEPYLGPKAVASRPHAK